MNRRQLLASTGALAAGGLAGCLGSAPGDGGDDQDDRTATEEPTDAPTGTPSLSDSTFTVENVASGGGENTATVTFDDPVVVEGTIGGRNGCYSARLQSETVEDGTLTVVVEAYERDTDGVCTEALVDIDYRVTFDVGASAPSRVVVKHVSMGETTTVADETA